MCTNIHFSNYSTYFLKVKAIKFSETMLSIYQTNKIFILDDM